MVKSYLSTVTLVNALDSVAVSIEHIVTPIIIQTTANSRANVDFGVLSPYLVVQNNINNNKYAKKKPVWPQKTIR